MGGGLRSLVLPLFVDSLFPAPQPTPKKRILPLILPVPFSPGHFSLFLLRLASRYYYEAKRWQWGEGEMYCAVSTMCNVWEIIGKERKVSSFYLQAKDPKGQRKMSAQLFLLFALYIPLFPARLLPSTSLLLPIPVLLSSGSLACMESE